MKAVDDPILAFIFVDDMLRQPRDKESDAFRSAVISRIPDLLKLNRLQYNSTMFVIHIQAGFSRDEVHSMPAPNCLTIYFRG